jgi:dTDP-4-dehydrorhamnose 3,5-epimerase
MRVTPLELSEVLLLEPAIFSDERGFFLQAYSRRELAPLGIDCEFVQDNVSRSRRGVLRGLHFQLQPHAQAKLVRVTHGLALDVVVDVRRGSPTFGRAAQALLGGDNQRAIFIPPGFAHGFYALEDLDMHYKCSCYYDPASERGVLWCDPDLHLPWPEGIAPRVSSRDARLPRLSEISDDDLLVWSPR